MTLDPVGLEVMGHAFASIAEEMGLVLIHSALSPNIRERRDCSATLFDPRERPVCDAGYWVDNLRYTVRFAAAVQAALEDGYRVFAELAPHPLLTYAVEHTARSDRQHNNEHRNIHRRKRVTHEEGDIILGI